MEQERPERDEVYERIPWETLEKKGGDRQWLVYAVAGAVALGALAYSFMRNQPTAPPPTQAVVATTVPATTVRSNIDSTPSTVSSPIVVAEADLYAVDPERLVDQAVSHAEWLALEYVAVDGTEQSRKVLESLLPSGVPLPKAPDGTQVFVDWVRARSVTQTGPVSFDVEVLVRSLVSTGEGGFVRQAPMVVGVGVEIGDDGLPRVSGVPSLGKVAPGSPGKAALNEVPEDLLANMKVGRGNVVGGVQQEDGTWEVVVMTKGPDGVRRPVTLEP